MFNEKLQPLEKQTILRDAFQNAFLKIIILIEALYTAGLIMNDCPKRLTILYLDAVGC